MRTCGDQVQMGPWGFQGADLAALERSLGVTQGSREVPGGAGLGWERVEVKSRFPEPEDWIASGGDQGVLEQFGAVASDPRGLCQSYR